MATQIVTSTILPLLLLLGALWPSPSSADPVGDKQALLDFIAGIATRSSKINWNASTPVCNNWVGVTCNADLSRVVAVRLPGVGLNGPIPPNTLGRLTALQTLSLRSNRLTGPFPPDFANITSLVDVHLQFNALTGPLPPDFSVWRNLVDVDLSFNRFNGSIPSSISNLTQLAGLDLSNNSLSGAVPDLQLPNLVALNLSNNNLDGFIPRSLERFPNSSFAGNHLAYLTPSSPSPSPQPSSPALSPPAATGRRGKKKLNESVLLGIIVGGCALAFGVAALFLILCCSKRRDGDSEEMAAAVSWKSKKLAKGDRSPERAVTASQDANNRLVFFDGCTFAFDLEDLLHASAEVLGKGTFGTAYKATLEDSTTVVVKRLKDVGVGRKEFEQQMEVVGGMKHENVSELKAYYYSKDEKLMVYDYYCLGSVSSLLHGKRGEGDRTPLDWDSRVRIAVGAARGIAHIHSANNGKLVHGNIKSSNVFLNQGLYGCVSDLGLTTLMNPMVAPVSRTAGYRAPEVHDSRKATQASDVYSFGVLLLELLTGRSPIQVMGGGDEIIHLVRWVQSVVREEWTAEVFDVELVKVPNIEEEMVEMLKIAMACVSRAAERRPKIGEVVRMIEDLRRAESGTRPSSEGRSEESRSPLGFTPPLQGKAPAGSSSFSIEAFDSK